jgi:hypothetical protein
MSETIKAPVVNRNNKDFTFTKGTSSKNHKTFPNMDFWYPYVTFEQIDNDPSVRTWFGDSLEAVNKQTRLIFIELAIKHFNSDTGEMNWTAWNEDAAAFTAGRETLGGLDDEIASWTDVNVKLGDQLTALVDDGVALTDPKVQELYAEMTANTVTHLKPLRLKKAGIEERYEKIVAARKAKEVATA